MWFPLKKAEIVLLSKSYIQFIEHTLHIPQWFIFKYQPMVYKNFDWAGNNNCKISMNPIWSRFDWDYSANSMHSKDSSFFKNM